MKLISINIERQGHLEAVSQLLKTEQPDVLCLQEVCATDVPWFADLLGMESHFAPMFFESKYQCNKGVAVFARNFQSVSSVHFAGQSLAGESVESEEPFEEQYRNLMYQLITATIEHDGALYTVNTTHLPVTKEGRVTWFQMEAIEKLLVQLEVQSEPILCGDTNAPRGREAFATLTERYTDNIPSEYTTSIDGAIHKAGPLELMVDGLFTSPAYRTENVRLLSGVSDHCAIVADVYRVLNQWSNHGFCGTLLPPKKYCRIV